MSDFLSNSEDSIFQHYLHVAQLVTAENLQTARILASCITLTNDPKERIKRIKNLLYHHRDTISKLELGFYKSIQLRFNHINNEKKQQATMKQSFTINKLNMLYQLITLELKNQLSFLIKNGVNTDIIELYTKQCINHYFNTTTIDGKAIEQRKKFSDQLSYYDSDKIKATDNDGWQSVPSVSKVNAIISKKRNPMLSKFDNMTQQASMIKLILPEILADIQTRWSEGDLKTEDALKEMKALKNSFGDLVEIPQNTKNIYKHLYRRIKLTKKIEAAIADLINKNVTFKQIANKTNIFDRYYEFNMSKNQQRVVLFTAMVYLLKGMLKNKLNLDTIIACLIEYTHAYKHNINAFQTRYHCPRGRATRDKKKKIISKTLKSCIFKVNRDLDKSTNDEQSYNKHCREFAELLGKIGRQSVAFISWSFFKSTPKRLFEETEALLKQESEEIEVCNRATTQLNNSLST